MKVELFTQEAENILHENLNAGKMEEIDKLLKCPICFEHLKTALMISHCSHTFCSLCIRKYMSYKNVCPVCHVPTYECDLKNNRLVDDIVLQFTSIRASEAAGQNKVRSLNETVLRVAADKLPTVLADNLQPKSSQEKDSIQTDKLQPLSSQEKDSIRTEKLQPLSSQKKDSIRTDKLQPLSSQKDSIRTEKLQPLSSPVSHDKDVFQADKPQDKVEKQHSDLGRFTRMKKKTENYQGDKLILDIFSPKRKVSTRAVTIASSPVIISTDEEDFEDCLRNSRIVNLNDKDQRKSSSKDASRHRAVQVCVEHGSVQISAHNRSRRTAQTVSDQDISGPCVRRQKAVTDWVREADISTDSLGSGTSDKENKHLSAGVGEERSGPSMSVLSAISLDTTESGPAMPVLSAISLDTTESLSHEEEEESTPLDVTAEYTDVKMPCPICGVEVKDQVINRHLDQCLASAEKKSSLRRVTPKRKYMAKLVYNIMSEQKLRKKLKEEGLSSKGDKQTLIKRHHDYVLMYNAECDSLNPRPVEQLIKELEVVEKAKLAGGTSSSHKQRVNIEKNSSPATIENALQAYEKTHKSQFDHLMKAARKSHKTKDKQSHQAKKIPLQIPPENGVDENVSKPVAMATDITGGHVTNSQTGGDICKERNSARPSLPNIEPTSVSCHVTNSQTGSNLGIDSNSSPSHALPNTGIDSNSSPSHALPNTATHSTGKSRTPKAVRRRIHRGHVTSTPSPTKAAGLGCSPFKSPKVPGDLVVPPSPAKCALFVEDSECGSDTEDLLFKKINSSIDTFSEDDQDEDCPGQSDWPALSQAAVPREADQQRAAPGEEVEDISVFATETVPTSLRSRHISGLSIESGMSTGSDESSILWVPSPVTMKIGTRRRSERVKAGSEDKDRGKDDIDEKGNGSTNMKRKRSTGSSEGGIAKRIKRRR